MNQYWIWLSQLEGISSKGLYRVLDAYDTPEEIYDASEQALRRRVELDESDYRALAQKDLAPARKILKDCRETGISYLTLVDLAYPEILRQIPDPPLVLYYRGRVPDFDAELAVAIVGHRKPSEQGRLTARTFGYQISKAGAIVVSGAAAGIDAEAMRGALNAGGQVVGVLGCGIDVVYPRCNRQLLEDVVDYGCLISEYPPGTPPLSWHFPVRNRIISGLCRAVVVVEAPKRSGALITARLALEQGRDVFAVPGNAGLGICAGSNDLLRQGAGYAEYGKDVVGEYLQEFPETLRDLDSEACKRLDLNQMEQIELRTGPSYDHGQSAREGFFDTKSIDKPSGQTYIDLQERCAGLPEAERAVYLAFEDAVNYPDVLIARTGLPTATVLSALTMLEIRGLIEALPGGGYQRNTNSEES